MSKLVQMTSVPLSYFFKSPMCGRAFISKSESSTNKSLLASSITSKLNDIALIFPYFLLATVNTLHCDKEADFKPKPKRPNSISLSSFSSRSEPGNIALSSSVRVIPQPLSRKQKYGSSAMGSEKMRISVANAEILLSIISATAVEKL